MDTIYYAAAGTLLFIGFTFLFTRFMEGFNRWKHTTRNGKSGWRMDRYNENPRKAVLRVSSYNENFVAKKKETPYQVNINSHLL
jgi:hypothetical protein